MRDFLGSGEGSRTGYCEQFASAMAIMARALGIPARVAVGFLRPEPENDGSLGLQLPRPARVARAVLRGCRLAPLRADASGPDRRGPVVHLRHDPGSDRERCDRHRPRLDDVKPLPDVDPAERGAPTAATEVVDAGSVAVAAARARRAPAGCPRRGAADAARLAPPASVHLERPAEERVEGAWDELRATAIDLGLGWDDGATLRKRARALAPALADDPGALRALEAVVLGVERSRFSRRGLEGPAVEAVVDGVAEVCPALERAVGDRARRRATWLPASLWRGRGRQLYQAGGSGSGA